MASLLKSVALPLLLSLLTALPLGGKSPAQIPEPPGPGRRQSSEDEAHIKMVRDMEKRRNEERQKQLKRDTEKLLQLVTELKVYVDKSNENILSIDVVKKADEIEKYAHSVKEKMRTAP